MVGGRLGHPGRPAGLQAQQLRHPPHRQLCGQRSEESGLDWSGGREGVLGRREEGGKGGPPVAAERREGPELTYMHHLGCTHTTLTFDDSMVKVSVRHVLRYSGVLAADCTAPQAVLPEMQQVALQF